MRASRKWKSFVTQHVDGGDDFVSHPFFETDRNLCDFNLTTTKDLIISVCVFVRNLLADIQKFAKSLHKSFHFQITFHRGGKNRGNVNLSKNKYMYISFIYVRMNGYLFSIYRRYDTDKHHQTPPKCK